mgnify:CR=1 FL=1
MAGLIKKSFSSRPRNNCDSYSRVLETLLNLQVAATRCERFLLLLRPQQLVRSQSLPALAQSSSTCGKDHLDITILLLGSPRSLPKTKWPLVWQLAETDWQSLRKTILLNNICDPCSRVLKNLLNIQATATATATAPATGQEPVPAAEVSLLATVASCRVRKVSSPLLHWLKMFWGWRESSCRLVSICRSLL